MRRSDYIQAVEGAILNQPKYWAKHHNDRVTSDSGTTTDQTPVGGRSYLTDDYKFLRENNLINNLVFSWSANSGIKTRTSGVNTYVAKAYTANKEVLGTEIVPNNKFDTDDISFFDYTIRCTKEYNSPERCLRLIGNTNTDNVAFGRLGCLTAGKIYRIKFDIKSSNTNIAVPALQPSSFGSIVNIQVQQISSSYQTFIAEGVSLTGNLGLYAVNAGGIIGATYDIDNISVVEVVIPEFKDAVQATEANQPFVGGGIAPNEKKRIRNLLDNKLLAHSDITIDSTESNGFTITTVLKPTFEKTGTSSNTGIFLNGMFVNITQASIGIFNATTGSIIWSITPSTKLRIITITANSAAIYCYVDGVLIPISNGSYTPFSSVLSGLLNNSSNDTFAGDIYHHQIFNKALSASEVQAQHTYLRSQYPEIEGINIGNQHWATSNYEGVVTGNGTIIPEVQPSTSTELITNEADRTFSEDTGWWTKIGETTIADGVVNILSTTGALSFIQKGLLIIGKIYQLTYTVSRYGSGAIKSDSINGAGTIPSSVGTHTIQFRSVSNIAHIGRVTPCDVDISDISFKEVGWADLTTPAWCYYNNDPLNGAVYGKLYNWPAVQAIAANPPAGWRVPSQEDFTQLATYLGGASVAGGKLKKEGLTYWNSPNTGATNESGFSAIGSGSRNDGGTFSDLGVILAGWCSDEYDITQGYRWVVFNVNTNISISNLNKKYGRSIRLIRN